MVDRKKLLVLPNEAIDEYDRYKQSFTMAPHRYFNPCKAFDLHFLYPGGNPRNNIPNTFYYPFDKPFWHPAIPFRLIAKGYTIIREQKIDIIRTYNPHLEGLYAVILSSLTGVPSVVSYHNPYWEERKLAQKTPSRLAWFALQIACEWVCKRAATKIWVVSTQLKKDLVKQGVSPEKISIVYNKVDTKQFRKHNPAKENAIIKKYKLKGKKVFLFVGRFVEQKNIYVLLNAFRTLYERLDKNTHLLMVSDGPMREDIEEWISARGLDDHISLCGFVANTDLPSYYHIATALVLPSAFEGFGIVLAEAQAAGTPIICSNIPHISDIVPEWAHVAYKIQPDNMVELCLYMEQLTKSQEAQKYAKRQAQVGQLMAEQFEWKKREAEDLKLYQTLFQ